jgi:hypothetical protein
MPVATAHAVRAVDLRMFISLNNTADPLLPTL